MIIESIQDAACYAENAGVTDWEWPVGKSVDGLIDWVYKNRSWVETDGSDPVVEEYLSSPITIEDLPYSTMVTDPVSGDDGLITMCIHGNKNYVKTAQHPHNERDLVAVVSDWKTDWQGCRCGSEFNNRG